MTRVGYYLPQAWNWPWQIVDKKPLQYCHRCHQTELTRWIFSLGATVTDKASPGRTRLALHCKLQSCIVHRCIPKRMNFRKCLKKWERGENLYCKKMPNARMSTCPQIRDIFFSPKLRTRHVVFCQNFWLREDFTTLALPFHSTVSCQTAAVNLLPVPPTPTNKSIKGAKQICKSGISQRNFNPKTHDQWSHMTANVIKQTSSSG